MRIQSLVEDKAVSDTLLVHDGSQWSYIYDINNDLMRKIVDIIVGTGRIGQNRDLKSIQEAIFGLLGEPDRVIAKEFADLRSYYSDWFLNISSFEGMGDTATAWSEYLYFEELPDVNGNPM